MKKFETYEDAAAATLGCKAEHFTILLEGDATVEELLAIHSASPHLFEKFDPKSQVGFYYKLSPDAHSYVEGDVIYLNRAGRLEVKGFGTAHVPFESDDAPEVFISAWVTCDASTPDGWEPHSFEISRIDFNGKYAEFIIIGVTDNVENAIVLEPNKVFKAEDVAAAIGKPLEFNIEF